MTAVAGTLGVSRSNLAERLAGSAQPRGRPQKAQDAAVPPLGRRLVVHGRPTATGGVAEGRTLATRCRTAFWPPKVSPPPTTSASTG